MRVCWTVIGQRGRRLHTGAADAGLVSSAANAVVGSYVVVSIVSVYIIVSHDLDMSVK
jgi:hypothetical protein